MGISSHSSTTVQPTRMTGHFIHLLANTDSMLFPKDSSSRFFSVESVAEMSVTVVSNFSRMIMVIRYM